MRTYWLLLSVLLAAPSFSAADPVLIPLRHVAVTEIEGLLLRSQDRRPAPGALIAPAEQGLLPSGITAWTVDERRNAFEVAGTDEAIRSFRQILQLLDVPARPVRLSIRILPMSAAGLDRLHAEPVSPEPPGRHPTDFMAAVAPDQLAVLERQAALSASDMTVSGNHSLHLLWASDHDQPPVRAMVMPRVNDDGTVTLLLSRSGRMLVTRRLSPGYGAVLLSQTLGTALVVHVRELIPPAPPAGH